MLPFYETHDTAIQFGCGTEIQFPMHMHREVELFYLRSGENTVSFSGNEHHLTGGEIAIAFPNEPHAYHGGQGEYLNFIFDIDFCPDFSVVFRHYRPEVLYLRIDAAAPDLKETLELVWRISADGQPDSRLLKGYLTVILFRIMEQLPLLSEQKFEKRDLTSQVLYYMMQHYQSELSLSDIASELGVSKYVISRIFSHQIKMGFNHYLNRMRLEQAVHLLTTTDESVTDIAFSCGFDSLRTFYRAFSEVYHMPPVAYRRAIIHGQTSRT